MILWTFTYKLRYFSYLRDKYCVLHIVSLLIILIFFNILFVVNVLLICLCILFSTDVVRNIYYNIIISEIQIIRYNYFL